MIYCSSMLHQHFNLIIFFWECWFSVVHYLMFWSCKTSSVI
jgi:hypothetical protein